MPAMTRCRLLSEVSAWNFRTFQCFIKGWSAVALRCLAAPGKAPSQRWCPTAASPLWWNSMISSDGSAQGKRWLLQNSTFTTYILLYIPRHSCCQHEMYRPMCQHWRPSLQFSKDPIAGGFLQTYDIWREYAIAFSRSPLADSAVACKSNIVSLPSSDFLVVYLIPTSAKRLASTSFRPTSNPKIPLDSVKVQSNPHRFLCAAAKRHTCVHRPQLTMLMLQPPNNINICNNCQHPANKKCCGTLSMLSSAVAASSKGNGSMIAMHSHWSQDASVQPASGGMFSMPIRKGAS